MIEISEEQLEQGLAMIRIADDCLESANCFFGQKELFPKKQCCKIPAFREAFESDSPIFFSKVRQIAGYEKALYNIILLQTGALKKLKVKRRAWLEFKYLYIYTNTVLFTFFPLYLANNEEIPFLSFKEVKEKEKDFSQKSIDQISDETGKKMKLINEHWFDWISYNFLNDFNQSDTRYYFKYARAIALLVELFLAGMQRNKIPDILGRSEKENEEFFQQIETELFSGKTRES